MEEIRNCMNCEYADICDWRLARDDEYCEHWKAEAMVISSDNLKSEFFDKVAKIVEDSTIAFYKDDVPQDTMYTYFHKAVDYGLYHAMLRKAIEEPDDD